MRPAFYNCGKCPHYNFDKLCPCVRVEDCDPWWSRWFWKALAHISWRHDGRAFGRNRAMDEKPFSAARGAMDDLNAERAARTVTDPRAAEILSHLEAMFNNDLGTLVDRNDVAFLKEYIQARRRVAAPVREELLADLVKRLRAKADLIEHEINGQDPADWEEIALMRETATAIEKLPA